MNDSRTKSMKVEWTFLHKFPLELLREILSLLDCNSLRAILCCYSHFRKHAVLVCDVNSEVKYESPFLGIPDVQHIPLSRLKNNERLIRKIKSYYLVKLYVLCTDLSESREFIDQWGYEVFDSSSFINFSERHCGESQGVWCALNDKLINDKGEYPQTIYTTASTGIEHKEKYAPGFPQSKKDDHCSCIFGDINSSISFSLVGLKIDSTDIVEGLHIETLRTLYINFQTCPDEVPIIQDLELPQLDKFVVHFFNHPPAFCNISVARGPMSCTTKSRNKVFEFCNSNGFSVFQRPHMNWISSVRQYDISRSLRFTSVFQEIRAVGLPDLFIKAMGYDNVVHFQWVKTVMYQKILFSIVHSSSPMIKCPRLKHFNFQTNIPETKLPDVTSSSPFMEIVRVYTTAPQLDITGLVPNVPSQPGDNDTTGENYLREVQIVCNLPAGEVGNKHVLLTDSDLDAICKSKRMLKLVLDGCFIGLANNLLQKELWECWKTTFTNCHIHLTLVRSAQERDNDQLYILSFNPIWSSPLSKLTVSQRPGIHGRWKILDLGISESTRMTLKPDSIIGFDNYVVSTLTP